MFCFFQSAFRRHIQGLRAALFVQLTVEPLSAAELTYSKTLNKLHLSCKHELLPAMETEANSTHLYSMSAFHSSPLLFDC